ncbi:MAG: DUF3822 family protein [Bacteroidota bacterium]
MEHHENPYDIKKTDPCFYNLPPASYRLQVGLTAKAIQYTVFDPEKRKFIAYGVKTLPDASNKEMYFDGIKSFVLTNDLVGLPYSDVQVVYETQQATLVPEALFDEAEAATFLNFNQQMLPDDVILTDRLKNSETANVFAVPAGLQAAIGLPRFALHHHASVFIEALHLLYKNAIIPQRVFIQVHATFFDMMVIENRRLVFYNSFAYKTAEDFLYFVMLVYEQLKMSAEQTGVTLMGEVLKNSALFAMLFKYIREVEFLSGDDLLQSSHILNDVVPHLYFSLFNTVLCEL